MDGPNGYSSSPMNTAPVEEVVTKSNGTNDCGTRNLLEEVIEKNTDLEIRNEELETHLNNALAEIQNWKNKFCDKAIVCNELATRLAELEKRDGWWIQRASEVVEEEDSSSSSSGDDDDEDADDEQDDDDDDGDEPMASI